MSENDRIVRCAIHPALGVARVGNAPPSEDWRQEYYLAPEVSGGAADPGPFGFKTPQGEVKREAARFRVYGYDTDGNVVKEITDADGEINWRVHLANRKAAWYQFHNAMDLKQYALVTTFRNPSYSGAMRRDLVIDPGSKSVSGRDRKGPQYQFEGGYIRFGGSPIRVPLGELRTDSEGRLIVLGGHGKSASADGSQAVTFANNDGWYDDTSDGPVRATVKLGERELEADPAMVAVAPPNYGQGLFGPVTMYDVVYDLFVREGKIEPPETLEFWRDIFPILDHLSGNQWVNQGVFFLFGPGSPSDLTDPEILRKLASPEEAHREDREYIFNWLRQPPEPWDEHPGQRAELPPPQPADLPPFYGDAFGDYEGLAMTGLAVTVTQYGWLKRWAEGEFIPGERRRPPRSIEDLPVAEQPATLDRAPLQDCLGGPFHPGIELTWTLRVPRMWKSRFRLNILPEDEAPRDDFGPVLTPEVAIGPDGPQAASGPGTLTRWMGIPWQTDEASCLSGYDSSTYLPLPSFWAARVPNEVLSWGAYERTADARLLPAQRFKHFDHRQFWLRDLQGSYQTRINNMVAEWDKIGIISEHPGPRDHGDAGLPAQFWVETGRSPEFTVNDPTWKQLLRAEHAPPERQTPADTEVAKQHDQALATAAELVPPEETAAEIPADRVRAHPRRRHLRRDSR